MTHASIILLGPYQSGKSTQRRLLAEALHLPHYTLNPYQADEFGLHYFFEAGFDWAQDDHVLETQGVAGRYWLMKPFEASAVERCLQDHPGHVIELGATLSVYEDEQLLRRVQHALAPHPNVILLLPSPNRERSYQVLRERAWAGLDIERNEHFVKHHSNHDLAKYTVFTQGKHPEETRDEILQHIRASGAPAPLLLIGPPMVGKSTISNLLGSRLELPQVGLDVVGWDYARAAGYDEEVVQRLRAQEGERAARHYVESVWASVLERVLAEHPGAIIDFGAGHSVYEEPDVFARVQQLLAPYHHVILLLPSPDLDETVRILKEQPRTTINGVDATKYVIDHPSSYALAKLVVYTDGKPPNETRDEILQCISL